MSQIRINSIVPVGGIPAGASGGGIIQCVSSSYTTGQTFSSIASLVYQDTGLTASINPSTTSSKILVLAVATHQAMTTANVGTTLGLKRGSTQIAARLGQNIASGNNIETLSPVGSIVYLDSPATTSSTTYTVQIAAVGGTTTAYFNRTYSLSTGWIATITLLEISG